MPNILPHSFMPVTAKITIDKFPTNAHVQFAKDQQRLDPLLVTEAAAIYPHAAVTSASALYIPQFTKLFNLDKCNLPWASFTPPPSLASANKKTFSSRWLFTPPGAKKLTNNLFPPLANEFLEEEHAGGDSLGSEVLLSASAVMYYQSQKKRREIPEVENAEPEDASEFSLPAPFKLLKDKVANFPRLLHQTPTRFEKEKMALYHLMEMLEWIDTLLKQIHAATARYQRG